MTLFCDDRAGLNALQNYLTGHQGCQHENRRGSALRMSCGPKHRANFAAKVNKSRNQFAAIRMSYGITISCGGLAEAPYETEQFQCSYDSRNLVM